MAHCLRFICGLLFALALLNAGKGELQAAAPLKVAIILEDSNDFGYADVLTAGLEQAEQRHGISYDTVLSPRVDKHEEDFLRIAKAGYDLIIVPTIHFQTLLSNNAGNFPKTRFAAIGAQIKAPNVASYVFADAEAAFLAGAAAALISQQLDPTATEAHKLGWVGGEDIPQTNGYITGYRQGAKHISPGIRIVSVFTNSFDDSQAGERAARTLFKDGSHIVMHAGGRMGLGVIQAAQAAHNFAIGLVADQDPLAPDAVLFSVLRRADTAVLDAVKSVQTETFAGGKTTVFNLANGGVGLSGMPNARQALGTAYPPDLASRLAQLAADINSKKISVDSGAAKGLCDCL